MYVCVCVCVYIYNTEILMKNNTYHQELRIIKLQKKTKKKKKKMMGFPEKAT